MLKALLLLLAIIDFTHDIEELLDAFCPQFGINEGFLKNQSESKGKSGH